MSNADPRCICTMAQSLTGDGCRYCQSQEYIDRLHEQIEEDEAASKEADELINWLHAHLETLRQIADSAASYDEARIAIDRIKKYKEQTDDR